MIPERDITIQHAAGLLNVSEDYVRKLIGQGRLRLSQANHSELVPLNQVLALKAEFKEAADRALDEMVALSQAMGLE